MPTLKIARRLIAWIFVALLYVTFVGAVVQRVQHPVLTIGDEAAAMLAFALGILLVFRTNTAYDRWWEARKHWGQLVNDTRNLALKSRAHVAADEQEFEKLDRLLIAFPHSLRLHLRGVDNIRAVPGFQDDSSEFMHSPGYIAGLIHQLLNRWNREGKLLDTIWVLDVHARSLLDICGACERIRNTPLAASYRSLIRWFIVLYVLLAPWSVSLDAGWDGLAVLIFAFAFLFGVELTAEVVEEPFGTEGDDLPLDGLCETMERFVRSASMVREAGDGRNSIDDGSNTRG